MHRQMDGDLSPGPATAPTRLPPVPKTHRRGRLSASPAGSCSGAGMGGLIFGHLQDRSGRVQISLSRDELGAEPFDNNDFLEVETPILQEAASGAAARPFVTRPDTTPWARPSACYLRISTAGAGRRAHPAVFPGASPSVAGPTLRDVVLFTTTRGIRKNQASPDNDT